MKKAYSPIIIFVSVLFAAVLATTFGIIVKRQSAIEESKPTIVIEAFWQCDNNTIMIAARGTYPEPVSSKYELFVDTNENNVLDTKDPQTGFAVALTLDENSVHLSQPIKVDEELLGKKIFIRLMTKNKDTAVAEAKCSHIKSIFKEEM